MPLPLFMGKKVAKCHSKCFRILFFSYCLKFCLKASFLALVNFCVCVEVLRPSQQLRSCRAGQLPINTVAGQAFLSVARPTGIQLLVFFCSSVPVVLFDTPGISRCRSQNVSVESSSLLHHSKPPRGPNNCMFWAMIEAEGEVGYP